MANEQKPPNRPLAATRGRAATANRGRAMTIEAIRETYDGNWVLVKMTGVDEMGYPARGKLLAYSPDRSEIHEAFEREMRAKTPGQDGNFYIFFAEPLLTSGPEFEAAVANAVEHINQALTRKRARRNR